MANKKYVPQGTYLACDKGTVPMEFIITNNNNTFLFGEPVANTGDMVPMVNVMPMGVCTVTSNPCVPAPIMWDGFEDGIFVGFFNPLLEDSVLPCGVGGKIEIYYSLEEATAACAEEGMGFWEKLAVGVLVVAAVALIVISGGAAIAAFVGAYGAGMTLAGVGLATAGLLETAGVVMGIAGLVKYANDGDEEALFKDVALGYLFLGIGAGIAKGLKMWKNAKSLDEVVEMLDDVPSVKNGEFARWFDNLTPNQLDEIWENKALRDKIKARIRHPGGLHEWLMVSRTNIFKRWGKSMDEIKDLRTSIDEVIFKNPPGVHGGQGSTKAHNEILDLIDNSNSYDEFSEKVIEWSENRLDGNLPDGFFN